MKPDYKGALIHELFSHKRLQNFQKGEIIVFPNASTLPLITYIESGVVEQYDVTPEGNKVVLNLFKAGSFFPVASAVNHTANTYHFEALGDVTARQATAEVVELFLLAHPTVVYDLLKRLYVGLDGVLLKLASTLSLPAQQRLLNELETHGKRFGVRQGDNSLLLRITSEKIAQQTGLARETVSRELKELKQKGILTMSRGEITLYDSRFGL